MDLRGADLSDKQLRDDLMTMLIAGHETTAAVLTWALFCLMQNPEAEKKVIDELEKAMPDGEDDNMGKNQSSYEIFRDDNELRFSHLCAQESFFSQHQLSYHFLCISDYIYGPWLDMMKRFMHCKNRWVQIPLSITCVTQHRCAQWSLLCK